MASTHAMMATHAVVFAHVASGMVPARVVSMMMA